jgi:hypothetical protein
VSLAPRKPVFFAPAAVAVLVNRTAHGTHLQRAEPDKLDLLSQDIAGDKQVELLRLFPEIRTEGGKNAWEKDQTNIALERCLITRMVQRGSAVVVKRFERSEVIERLERLERKQSLSPTKDSPLVRAPVIPVR